ncbi:MAG: diaminopimelate decarboxylase [SAR324 cluster bacterium]|nr:diaminopimelate decarboxylase [SAR324 cluster bacterium]
MKVSENKLYLENISAELIMQKYGSPLYVYEESVLRSCFRQLISGFPEGLIKIHYSMKANSNQTILKILCEEGSSIDAVSEYEVRLALESGFEPDQIIFTGNNNNLEEIEYCVEQKVLINIGSLALLELFGNRHSGMTLSVRINPGLGAGHHAHCITGGPDSKFGIYLDQIDSVLDLANKYNLTINGIHSHIGTGIFEAEPMLEAMEMTLAVAEKFPELQFVDFGGGFGIPYRPDQSALDMNDLSQKMTQRFRKFVYNYGRDLEMKIEPGKLLVGPAGILLTTVTNISETPKYRFVGVDSGFNHLLRPTIYGAYHRIINASCVSGNEEDIVVVGNICESGDILSRSGEEIRRRLPSPKIGDRLALLDVGAYGMSMSSQYNFRPRPAEILVNDGLSREIRSAESYDDLTRNFPRI